MPEERTSQGGLEIPYRALSSETLTGLVESFVLREGTDYGAEEAGFEAKVAQVLRQLEAGEAKIVFDPEDETCAIVPVRGPASARENPGNA
jgi:uncharacterized protein YheU (UPF0270 family)